MPIFARSRRRIEIASVECLERRCLLSAVRIASWNTLNNPDTALEDADFETVLEAIGNESVAGTQQPIDILALQETDFAGSSGSIGRIETILDGLYPTTDYAHIVTSLDVGDDATGFVYNTTTMTLLENLTVPGALTHTTMRAKFRPAGVSTTDRDFYIYSTHLKAGTSSSDATRRANEATILRNNADALGAGENVIIVGDFNLQGSFETAWTNLTASGNAQLFDPISRPGNWHNNSSFTDIHTQNPQNDPGGGFMDDRFDFQLISGEFTDGGGIEYIPGSYRAFGNNGTHGLNNPITSGNGASTAVLSALAAASDHLPVVVDYDIGQLSPGVRIIETDGGTGVAEGGATDTYTVVLNTQPSANVTVTLTVDSQLDLGAGPGVPLDLTFTSSNGLTPQLVTVTAVDDLTVESTHFSTIVHSTTSTDSAYDMIAGTPDVSVTIEDNDTQLVISELMYNPLSDETVPGVAEWIEIVNTGNGAVDLSGWTFDDEDSGTNQDWGVIPNGTTLAVDQVAVFFDSTFTTESTFRSEWSVPATALVIGIPWGDLSNSPSSNNEILELLDSLGTSIDLVNYDDASTWPSDNPEGPSIYLENLAFNNNFGQNWSRSVVGVENGVSPSGPTFNAGDIGSPGRAPGVSAPQSAISVDDVTLAEDGGSLIFTISVDQAPDSDVMVDYATADMTAVAGIDYTAVTGTATIAAMTTSTTVAVAITDDGVTEGTETFELNLSSPTGPGLIVDGTGVGSIVDDFVNLALNIAGPITVTEGTSSITLELVISGPPAEIDAFTYVVAIGDGLGGGGTGTPPTFVATPTLINDVSTWSNTGSLPTPQAAFGNVNPPGGSGQTVTLPHNVLSMTIDTSQSVAGDSWPLDLNFNNVASVSFAGATFDIVSDPITINVVQPGSVVGRELFYNQSEFDGGDIAANAADDGAIDTSKVALLGGNTASFANYTGHGAGINGIMIDIANLPATPVAADFEFRVGNDDAPSGWPLLASAPIIDVRPGAGSGGSDRVTLIWPDETIANTWLQVTVRSGGPNAIVGTDDVFYFGSAPGEVGLGNTRVDSADFGGVSANFTSLFGTEAVTSAFDVDKSGRVDSADAGRVSASFTGLFETPLALITPPASEVLEALPASVPFEFATAEATPFESETSMEGAPLPATIRPQISTQAVTRGEIPATRFARTFLPLPSRARSYGAGIGRMRAELADIDSLWSRWDIFL